MACECGCRVLTTRKIAGRNVYQLDCESHDAKVALLGRLARYDATSEASAGTMRALAQAFCDKWGGSWGKLPVARGVADMRKACQEWAHAASLQAAVKSLVRFRPEEVETFEHSLRTLELGYGDCDDHARLVAALGLAIGLDMGLAVLRDAEGYPRHVAATLLSPGVAGRPEGLWLETTIAARFGEPPMEAAKRLGIATRPDLVG